MLKDTIASLKKRWNKHIYFTPGDEGMDKIEFIYVGRLVKEKGFDLILQLLELISERKLSDRVIFHIFSDGPLRDQLEEGLEKWGFVHYYGQQPKETLMQIRKNCHYCLMPSQFLETFGLAALDSISLGVPVVGFAKGGLNQFIKNRALSIENGEHFIDTIVGLIEGFNQEEWLEMSNQSRQLYKNYTREAWLEKFQGFSGLQPGAKVLLVSDYIVDVGGIESFLFNVKQLLEKEGYIVEMVGCADKKKAMHRFAQLFGTLLNRKGAGVLKQKIQEFSPDLVWLHSVHRWRGWYPLQQLKTYTGKQRVMYHDFGLLYPYPSCLYDVAQLAGSRGFWGYLQTGIRDKGVLQTPLLLIKYLLTKKTQRYLGKHANLHLVPSTFMEAPISAAYNRQIEVATLPHFI